MRPAQRTSTSLALALFLPLGGISNSASTSDPPRDLMQGVMDNLAAVLPTYSPRAQHRIRTARNHLNVVLAPLERGKFWEDETALTPLGRQVFLAAHNATRLLASLPTDAALNAAIAELLEASRALAQHAIDQTTNLPAPQMLRAVNAMNTAQDAAQRGAAATAMRHHFLAWRFTRPR